MVLSRLGEHKEFWRVSDVVGGFGPTLVDELFQPGRLNNAWNVDEQVECCVGRMPAPCFIDE